MFLFGDFVAEIDDYDWIDIIVFSTFCFITLILLTNVLIAEMGNAYTQVHETMDICDG
jgi:hypothetical protein